MLSFVNDSLFRSLGTTLRRKTGFLNSVLTLCMVSWLPAVTLPNPTNSGIEHVVVVMMENRSFDHMLGWVPGADGRQAGLTYTNRAGQSRSTYPLAPDYQGCAHPDPDHSYAGGRIEWNNGACDGWLRAGRNDEFAIGYYTAADLPFMSAVVSNFTVCDRYFGSIMAGTYPNRFYQHAAQTDRIDNSLTISDLPTIWDRLDEKGISRRYYFSDLPFIALWGLKYLPITRLISEFYEDCRQGTLPAVSFVEPRFFGAMIGTSNDDHPRSDIRNGEIFLSQVYEAIRTSPNWSNTVLVINFDEWGGFFEHVPPPTSPIPPADLAAGNQDGLLGFRVPCFVISPFARRGHVAHEQLEHSSILKMIEWRWGLEPLTVRDQTARNLAEVLTFPATNFTAPAIVVPQGPFGQLCLNQLSIFQAPSNSFSVSWLPDARLQTATNLNGPWTTVTNTSNSLVAGTNSQQFFRVVDKWARLVEVARQFGFPGF